MSHIDTTIARIPSMDAKSRANLRVNATNTMKKDRNNGNARRVLDALSAFEDANSISQRLEITGLLAWEKHRHGKARCRAFHEDRPVGSIFKHADHTSTAKDVYSVEILGQNLPRLFQHIKDARVAGEAAFAGEH
jgi:hypothetical protein